MKGIEIRNALHIGVRAERPGSRRRGTAPALVAGLLWVAVSSALATPSLSRMSQL